MKVQIYEENLIRAYTPIYSSHLCEHLCPMLSDKKYLEKLGRKIESLSVEKFRTQTEFSDACEVDTRTIRRIIKAEQNPTILILRKIAFSLEIEVHDLVKIETE